MTEALTFDALGVVRAIEIALTQDVHVHLLAGYLGVWLGCVALRALAVVARVGVLADRARWTSLFQGHAFVDVRAALEGISRVVRPAAANERAGSVRAHRVRAARILQAFIDVLTLVHCVAGEALRALALEAALDVPAQGVPAARRSRALIHVATSGGFRIALEAGRAVALVAALEIRANRSRPTGVGQQALVDVAASVVWVSFVADAACASVISGRVEAVRVHAARSLARALVHVRAQDLSVALEARIALALPLAGLVAAPGVLHALGGDRRILTLVNVFALEAIALVAFPAFALEAAHRVVAGGKNVARPVIALVLVCKKSVGCAEKNESK